MQNSRGRIGNLPSAFIGFLVALAMLLLYWLSVERPAQLAEGQQKAAQLAQVHAVADARAKAAAREQERVLQEQERQRLAAVEREERLAKSKTATRDVQRLEFRPAFSPNTEIVLLTNVSLVWEKGIYKGEEVTFDRIRKHEFRIYEPRYGTPHYNIYLKGPARSGFGDYLRDIDCRRDRASCEIFYNSLVAAMNSWRSQYGDLY
ncbi:hypothetical protein DFR48_11813 [Ciceribacter lividus]|uniref:Uncharacterized protein n=1 Tax=Ciceribacter lividus TaxID=1197950 RepID=A0A6I7HFX8_9HYPH|nr:hypothetical protein [Ciceribacter lividus]RCW19808.1 hypothetical protein DFR48_11813 [Ciceribacter lividus]